MNKGELTGLFLLGFGGSGLLFIAVHKLSLLVPVFIAQHDRLSLIGLACGILLLVGSFVLTMSAEQ